MCARETTVTIGTVGIEIRFTMSVPMMGSLYLSEGMAVMKYRLQIVSSIRSAAKALNCTHIAGCGRGGSSSRSLCNCSIQHRLQNFVVHMVLEISGHHSIVTFTEHPVTDENRSIAHCMKREYGISSNQVLHLYDFDLQAGDNYSIVDEPLQ